MGNKKTAKLNARKEITVQNGELRAFRERALRATVRKETREQYGRIVQTLKEQGAINYVGFLAYIKNRWGKRADGRVCAASLRAYKSTLTHEMKCETEKGMTEDESADLDEVLSGVEAMERENNRRPVRGAIDEERLWVIVQAAHKAGQADVADGCIVAQGCLLRPRDVGELCVERTDLKGNFVWVRSKNRITSKGEEYEAHAIGTISARDVIARRVKKCGAGPLFEKWNTAVANNLIKRVAESNSWNTASLKFDGMHTLRHGGAVDQRRLAEEVRQAGGWKSITMARWYGRER